MPQWTLDEGFVAWLRMTMSPEQVSMLDLNGVMDDIYHGYCAGIAAERAKLALVIEAAKRVVSGTIPIVTDESLHPCVAVRADVISFLRTALRDAEEGK